MTGNKRKEKGTIWRSIVSLVVILLFAGIACGAPGGPNFSYTDNKDLSVSFSAILPENVTSLSWDFGDGATSIEKDPMHTYESAGEYSVTLTINGGSSVTKTVKVTAALPPIAKLTADITEGLGPLKVHFTDESENAEGDLKREVDFGDGTIIKLDKSGSSFDHTFAARLATYDVILTLTDKNGKQSQSSVEIKAKEVPILPVAGFSATPTSGYAPLEVTFADESQYAAFVSLDFGDGTFREGKGEIIHTYKKAGTYLVKQTATNINGSTTKTIPIIVEEKSKPVLPVANFEADPTNGKAPLKVKFTDLSKNAEKWDWNFGDGASSKEQNPSYTYTTAGNYTAKLTVSNGNGTAEKSAEIVVTGEPGPGPKPDKPVVASFTAKPTSGYAPLNVQLTDTSTGSPTAWEWNFGDGVSSKTQNPSHTYTTPGTYKATLTVENKEGIHSSRSMGIQAFEPEGPTKAYPEAGFTFNVVEGCPQVEFTDQSKHATSWLWCFGDGSSSTEKNPVHTYTEAGDYHVNLTVFNENGENSISKTVTVEAEEEKSSSGHGNCGGMIPTSPAPVKNAKIAVCLNKQTTASSDETVEYVTKKTGANVCNTAPKIIINENSKIKRLYAGVIPIIPTIKVDEKESARHHSGVRLQIIPRIDFNASVIQEGGKPSIQFYGNCSRDVEEWYWDFGDGAEPTEQNTEQNPAHKYTEAGIYTVSLTVIEKGRGYEEKLTKIDYIIV